MSAFEPKSPEMSSSKVNTFDAAIKRLLATIAGIKDPATFQMLPPYITLPRAIAVTNDAFKDLNQTEVTLRQTEKENLDELATALAKLDPKGDITVYTLDLDKAITAFRSKLAPSV